VSGEVAACVFCAIVARRLPASVVAESDLSLAFCDLRQPHPMATGGHVLIVPRRHFETLDMLDDDSAADLLCLSVQVAAKMRAAFGDSYSLWQSNGEAAFQEVPHVHLHLLTRLPEDELLRIYSGDGKPPVPAQKEQLDALAETLRRHSAA
jgi:histidine triad (HIT) family protein